ncbi:related to YNG2 - component of NuA4 histone acetyltransferase complex [Pseudozyma flocculosa]|uniref:Chromatin modification-related protein n=1 Tax=Pseudozyma flocculosa TaxID=84751 RepID=A0A5C3EY97_9BASI|nr:related to YNG2 - component of NuA4 histone acetyltransferase complex [Pseudozyma flocculosa]
MSIIEDPAEIAALANEFISSLDNLPQEISHLVKEIEHKDAKVQDIMPKISARETQLRELLQKGGSGPANPSGILSEADRLKAEKLTDKIRQDYRRADEWSAQKESLSLRMWRAVHAHHLRLREEMAKISPAVLANYGGAMAAAPPQIPSLASLPAALAGVRSPAVELDATVAGLTGSIPGTPGAASGRGRWAGRTTPVDSGTPAPPDRTGNAPSSTLRAGSTASRKARGSSSTANGPGRSSLSNPLALLDPLALPSDGVGSSLDGMDFAGAGAEGDDGEEKDETLYCFCQRVSFGEMIGCDNAENDPECKEWFHISCVGVTKPLPAKWYCSECAAKIKNKRRRQA